jgi:M6 family metalloprotease-like protein
MVQRDGSWRVVLGFAVALTSLASPAAGQVAIEAVRTADGLLLDLPETGAWRVRARQVEAVRVGLRQRRDFAGLNAALRVDGLALAPAAVSGVLYAPAILFGFSDTDTTATTALPRPARYDSLYFGLTPPAGRSYSLRTLYREMSNDLFDVQGQALGWVLGANDQAYYLEACGADNAIDCPTGRSRLYALWTAALVDLDATVDFGLFDNDGPDGVPNSSDDDGFVDVVQFTQPVVGGECGGPGIWAHRWFLSALGGTSFQTNDPRPGGGVVRLNSYYVGSGVGGAGPGNRAGCGNSSQIAGIGTMAHEFGHAIGLPDLYDTGGGTQGIGEWGLMGSGGYTSANSPTHLEAWSKERLGWVAVAPLTTGGSPTLSPVVSQDTVLLVRPPAGVVNPRGEYFLLENRQAVGSDTANMITGGNAGPKNGGLLVWHIDSAKVVSSMGVNQVNVGSIHGVALTQADGFGHLDLTSGGNRGDGGDPFPGAAGRTSFTNVTVPAARKNDGAFAGFEVDSIRQVTPGGAMAFRIRFGLPLLVSISGPGVVTSTPAVPADTLLSQGDVVTLAAVPNSGALFQGWSGDTTTSNDTLRLTMARAWSVTAGFAAQLVASPPAPGTAVMGANYSLSLSATGGTGSYSWLLLSGVLPQGVTLKSGGVVSGVPEQTGDFSATVRVTSGTQTQAIPVSLSVTAPALTTSSVLGVLLGTGGTLTTDERRYLDLLGNRNNSFDVGDFHAFIAKTGGAVSAEMMAELLRKEAGR